MPFMYSLLLYGELGYPLNMNHILLTFPLAATVYVSEIEVIECLFEQMPVGG